MSTRRIIVGGPSGARAGTGPKLSRHDGGSPDSRLRRRNHRTASEFRGTRIHRRPRCHLTDDQPKLSGSLERLVATGAPLPGGCRLDAAERPRSKISFGQMGPGIGHEDPAPSKTERSMAFDPRFRPARSRAACQGAEQGRVVAPLTCQQRTTVVGSARYVRQGPKSRIAQLAAIHLI